MEQNNQQQQFKCSGNCLNCLPAQRGYCASQHAYSNMKVLDRMMDIVMEMKGTVDEMKIKIEAMQNNESLLFDPNEEEEQNPPSVSPTFQQTTIAHEGSGAAE